MGVENAPVPVSRSARPEFGEYQFNGAMALAKQLKQKPRDIADKIVETVKLDDIASKLEVAGPGFINVHLNDAWLSNQCELSLTAYAAPIAALLVCNSCISTITTCVTGCNNGWKEQKTASRYRVRNNCAS